jgi:hypothetical protein
MERRFGQAGPVIYWMLNWMTMGAGEIFFPYCSSFHIAIVMYAEVLIVGLPMESLFTLIGLKWAGYFLSFCKSNATIY